MTTTVRIVACGDTSKQVRITIKDNLGNRSTLEEFTLQAGKVTERYVYDGREISVREEAVPGALSPTPDSRDEGCGIKPSAFTECVPISAASAPNEAIEVRTNSIPETFSGSGGGFSGAGASASWEPYSSSTGSDSGSCSDSGSSSSCSSD